jgi:hypothetical protein
LRGSHSSQRPLVPQPRRPKDNGDDGPPDDGGEPPPPPPPPVSVPDLALQFSVVGLSDADRDKIVEAIRKALKNPDADVRPLFLGPFVLIGIWLRPFVNENDNKNRDRGMRGLSLIQADQDFAFWISSTLIKRMAAASWDLEIKQRNSDGDPDSNGPIHLTSFSPPSFEFPDRVVTKIGGFDERPFPDVNFTLTITDTLVASAGEVTCKTKRDLDMDTSWLDFLTGLFLLELRPLGAFFLEERIMVGAADPPDTGAGPGCDAAAMIPRKILFPGKLKLVPFYKTVTVFANAIIAGGLSDRLPRVPQVFISGPTKLSVGEGTSSVLRTFAVKTDELLPDLQIVWGGDGFPLQRHAETTGIRFNLGNTSAGQVLIKRVSVRVTDADGLAAEADMVVHINITAEERVPTRTSTNSA